MAAALLIWFIILSTVVINIYFLYKIYKEFIAGIRWTLFGSKQPVVEGVIILDEKIEITNQTQEGTMKKFFRMSAFAMLFSLVAAAVTAIFVFKTAPVFFGVVLLTASGIALIKMAGFMGFLFASVASIISNFMKVQDDADVVVARARTPATAKAA